MAIEPEQEDFSQSGRPRASHQIRPGELPLVGLAVAFEQRCDLAVKWIPATKGEVENVLDGKLP